jgi:hypothetical protein
MDRQAFLGALRQATIGSIDFQWIRSPIDAKIFEITIELLQRYDTRPILNLSNEMTPDYRKQPGLKRREAHERAQCVIITIYRQQDDLLDGPFKIPFASGDAPGYDKFDGLREGCLSGPL